MSMLEGFFTFGIAVVWAIVFLMFTIPEVRPSKPKLSKPKVSTSPDEADTAWERYVKSTKGRSYLSDD